MISVTLETLQNYAKSKYPWTVSEYIHLTTLRSNKEIWNLKNPIQYYENKLISISKLSA